MSQPVLCVRDLSVEYRIDREWLRAVRDVDLAINPLQIHGLVGESGSGKSTLALAMMGFLVNNARITAGSIRFNGTELRDASIREVERIWGAQIALVPQNPMDALNPSLRVSRQMMEVTRQHLGLTAEEAQHAAVEALRHVQIADPERVIRRYPHQLSGGMLQRVMIAMALSTRPNLLILDEPTTALDVTTQAVILDLMRALIKEERAAGLYVSHDLGTVAQLCDYVTVLYAGEVMESAPVGELFARPLHPYTVGLLASLPTSAGSARLAAIGGVAPSLMERGDACVFADRCPVAMDVCRRKKPPLQERADGRTVRCWRADEISDGSLRPFDEAVHTSAEAPPRASLVLTGHHLRKRFGDRTLVQQLRGHQGEYVQALQDVSVKVNGRSTFGLVGESGSGKTTLARALLALTEADDGEIDLLDHPIGLRLRRRNRETLRNLRIVFQNPEESLNPYRTVGQTITRTIRKLSPDRVSAADARRRTEELLQAVGLSAEYFDRRPSNLSGGEKQRVAIARAFAPNPALIVADEPTSSLDVSVQAVILNLLKDLRATQGASYLLISHDLEVVGYLADHIAVMYLGEIVEQGANSEVLSIPSHPYTEALLSAVPVPDPRVRHRPIRLGGEVPSPRNRPSGCPFHTRCPRVIGPICSQEAPPVQVTESGHEIRCHYTPEELFRLQSDAEPGEGGAS